MAKRCSTKNPCKYPRANWWKQSIGVDWFNQSSGGDTPGETPTQQAHSIAVGERTETTETITWSNSIDLPDGYIILAKSGGAVDSYPADGTSYNFDAEFGSGDQIGTGNYVVGKVLLSESLTVTVTGLTAGTTYHYRVMAYNGSGSGIKYRTTDEKGHLWVTEEAPPSGMIGTDINAAHTLEVRSGGETIYYRTRATVNDAWGSWTLWATVAGAQFHSLRCLEGGTIHNASGTPVSIKWMFNDHSGTGTIYAGYTPGDTPEEVTTGAGAQKWNEGAWNASLSEYVAISDDGSNRIVTLTNARTAAYTNVMDSNSIASVCATSDATIPFVACFKNAGTPGEAIAARISGTWTPRSTPLGKVFHMIKQTPGLGGSDTRMFCSSADGTGNDGIWSDDYFATYTSSDITGEFGAFAFDDENIRIAVFSRTAGGDIAISTDAINFELIDNPVANAVLFNGVSDGNGFNAQASSGSSLGIKTTPSNIISAETRFEDYVNYTTYLTNNAIGLPADNTIRDVFYGLRDYGLWDKFQVGWFADKQTVKAAVTINLKDPGNFTLTEEGTIDFSTSLGIRSASSSYFRTGFIPATHNADPDSIAICHRVNDNVEATQFDYGCQDATGATERISINTHATDDTIASLSLNSSSVAATGSQTDSTGRYVNNRTGSTAADHDLNKNAVEFDGSNAARTSQPSTELYWCAFNSNGTASLFCTRYQGYLLIFTGLTPTEITNLDTLLDY